MIRRLRCSECGKIHHELPGFLAPYKHFDAESVEKGATQPSAKMDIDVEESTLWRWRKWYQEIQEWMKYCVASLKLQLNMEAKTGLSIQPLPVHPDNGQKGVGNRLRLTQIVRILVNSNFWRSTRFAFLS
jgi:hypothetical protein